MGPRIALVTTGGTIACDTDSGLDFVNYGDGPNRLDGNALLQRVAHVAPADDVLVVDACIRDSHAITPQDWLSLRRSLLETIALVPTLEGVIVTHGTASLEDTAYFLWLTMGGETTIVLTGAQRPWGALGSDSAMNLINSMLAARSERLRGFGTIVVFDGEVHSPRVVVKSATYGLSAFTSSGSSALARVGPLGEIRVRHRPNAQPGAFRALTAEIDELPYVEVICSYPGSSGSMINAAIDRGARGLVIQGMTPGLLAPADLAAVNRARSLGVTVIVGSRSSHGEVVIHGQLKQFDVLSGLDLPVHKLRIALSVGLACGLTEQAIQAAIA